MQTNHFMATLQVYLAYIVAYKVHHNFNNLMQILQISQ